MCDLSADNRAPDETNSYPQKGNDIVSSPLIIIVTILVFGIIIMIHELGHFLAAKLSKVKVYEFNIGMGPIIWASHKKKHEHGTEVISADQNEATRYAIRALPIGGSVSMAGEDESSNDQDAFCNKPIWKRFIILVAGAAMNLLLGLVILICIFATVKVIPTRVIATFRENAASEQGGLHVGDEILRVNGRTAFVAQDVIQGILSDDDGVVDFVVRRDGQKMALPGVAFDTIVDENARKLDIDFYLKGEPNSIRNTLQYSVNYGLFLGRMIWVSVGDLIFGRVGFDQLSGPIGVGEALGQAASRGMADLFMLVAFLTINVGIFNLLPFPALDGGRLVFLLVEGVIRRPVPAQYERAIHAVGLFFLFGLMFIVAISDILNLF